MRTSKAGAAAALALLMTVAGAATTAQAAPVAAAGDGASVNARPLPVPELPAPGPVPQPPAEPTTPPITPVGGDLSDQEHYTNTQGKRVGSTVFYNRSSNRLTTTLSVYSPYLFHGARGTSTTTVFSGSGAVLWRVTHGLTACGVLDACSSDVTETRQHTPPASVALQVRQEAAYVTTSVSVS